MGNKAIDIRLAHEMCDAPQCNIFKRRCVNWICYCRRSVAYILPTLHILHWMDTLDTSDTWKVLFLAGLFGSLRSQALSVILLLLFLRLPFLYCTDWKHHGAWYWITHLISDRYHCIHAVKKNSNNNKKKQNRLQKLLLLLLVSF